MGGADFELVGWVALSKDLFEECELDRESVLDQVTLNGVEGRHVHVAI